MIVLLFILNFSSFIFKMEFFVDEGYDAGAVIAFLLK